MSFEELVKKFSDDTGVNCRRVDGEGKTFLIHMIMHPAISLNTAEVYSMVQETGVMCMHRDNSDRTALCYASRFDNGTMVRALILSGNSNPGHVYEGKTFLMEILSGSPSEKEIEWIYLLFRNVTHLKLNHVHPKTGLNAFILACRYGPASIVSMMLNYADTLDFDQVSSHGATALSEACMRIGVHEIGVTMKHVIKQILKYSSDATVNQVGTAQKSPLLLVQGKDPEIEDLILKRTTSPTIMMKYLSIIGFESVLMKEISELDAVRSLLIGEKSILARHSCIICSVPCAEGFVHKCGARYHYSCIGKCVSYTYKDIVVAGKEVCQACRVPLTMEELGTIRTKYPDGIYAYDKTLDTTKINKPCQKCRMIFEVCEADTSDAPMSHGTTFKAAHATTDMATGAAVAVDDLPSTGDRIVGNRCTIEPKNYPDQCFDCQNKIITCPKCGMKVQHGGKCNQFTCCLYGTDTCNINKRGGECDHGSGPTFKFCGHQWDISRDLMDTGAVSGICA